MAYFQAQNHPFPLRLSFILYHIFSLDNFISMTGLNHSLFNKINTTAFDAGHTLGFTTSHTADRTVYKPTNKAKSYSNTEANAKTKHIIVIK